MKITNHHELRKDVSIDCSEPILTDQSMKNACDINVIMANYVKTGMLPELTQIPARYVDNSTIPSLEESFNIVNRAYEAFMDLPPEVRKLMDNDPAKLEIFINDPKNERILVDYGVLVSKEPVKNSQEKTEQTIQTANTQL